MKVLKIEDEFYPESLREIENPPKQLYLLGDEKILSTKNIAIIGSRKCSEYGKKQGNKFAYSLAKEKITITSGMALGIDTTAHMGALNAEGKTIAVLGSGFEHIYPEQNKKLFHSILEKRRCYNK